MTDSVVRLDLDVVALLKKYDCSGKLLLYFDLLREENKKVNIVSRETIDLGLEVLAAESLLPLGKIGGGSVESYLDIGSGGGFPAIPLILSEKIQKAVLFERTSKKSLALERILKGLELDKRRFRIEYGDFEQVPVSSNFDLITMRLVKLTPKLLRKIHSVLRVGGSFAYYSGIPENISMSSFSHLSYCYRVDKNSPEKQFTIFKKTD